MTFTKLFSSITESTVWCEPDRTRLVWICMLAMADRKGRVFASVPGLANRSRVPIEDAQTAIDTFLSPDKYSRTPEFEGRRIEPIDGGWRLLNHEKYRSIRDEETTKEHKRNYINKRRAAEKQSTVDHEDSTVERCRDNAEAEAESVKKTTSSRAATTFVAPEWVPSEQWTSFVQMRKAMKSVPFTNAAAAGIVRELEKLKAQGHDPASVLENSVMNGWRSVFAPKTALQGKTWADNKADVAHATVPGTDGPDPALAKILADEKKAAPMPENIRAKLDALRKTA
jgi:hypothetical protein